MKRITVFCGSSLGTDTIYENQAIMLGEVLTKHNIGLVYGGANVGLMGAIANSVLKNNGEVIGVIPHFLQQKEIAYNNLSQFYLVDTMHERKNKMNDLSNGVIAMPGGFGTLEEFFEMLTWAQLGLHQKPIGILNISGFYDELLNFIDTMVNKGFLKNVNRDMILVSDQPDVLIEKMKAYKAPNVSKWITKETN